MGRKMLIRSNYFPYHVVNRTLDQKFYALSKEELWKIFSDCLCILTWVYGVRVHAFVLMGNHYHLLISTPEENLDAAMRYLQTEVSKRVAERTGSSAYCFESRYKWSVIYHSAHYLSVLKYVYQNPLRAALAKSINDYPWSTAHGTLGYSNLNIPLSLHELQADHFAEDIGLVEFEKWVNELYPELELFKIRKGLRRFEFHISEKNARKKANEAA
jgi:putative transposase